MSRKSKKRERRLDQQAQARAAVAQVPTLGRSGCTPDASWYASQTVTSHPALAAGLPPAAELFAERYVLEAPLSSDDACTLYRARDKRSGRPVSIAVLDDSDDAPARARFARAVAELAALDHPNIASILDHGVSRLSSYVVLEWLDGESLAKRLSHGALSFDATLSIIRQLLAALASAQAAGLVHGHLTASRVFLQQRKHGLPRVKLLDFRFTPPSAAKPTATMHAATVTPEIPSPIVRAKSLWAAPDARGDVLSVGRMLAEMLGHAAKVPALVAATPLEAPVSPIEPIESSDNAALNVLIERATAEDPAQRYSDAADMLCALIDAVPRAPSLPLPEAAPSEPHVALPVAPDAREPTRNVPLETTTHLDALPRRQKTRRAWHVSPLMAASGIAALAAAMLFGAALRDGSALAAWHELRARVDSFAQSTSGMDDSESPQPAHAGVLSKTDVSAALSEAEAQPDEEPPAPTVHAAARPPEHKRNVPPARNPWLDPIPTELQGLPAYLATGGPGDEHMVRTLREYNLAHRATGRGHLLLGHLYFNRLWRTDCLAEWTAAFDREPSLRGAPDVLPSLIQLVAQGKLVEPASDMIARVYGREALDALDAALPPLRNSEAASRVRALRSRIGAQDPQ